MVIQWVPGHENFEGNEKADKLAKMGANGVFIGPEPVLGVHEGEFKEILNQWIKNQHDALWKNVSGLRQSKMFILQVGQKNLKNILKLNRKDLRVIVGLYTGHCQLRRHLKIIGVINENPECRLCKQEPETAYHILCECTALARLRMEIFGVGFPEPNFYSTCSLRETLQFAEKTELLTLQ